MSERIVNTNGAAIYVTESGVAEPALVFLHYWGASSRTWQDVVDRLGETRRVIVLDQRGWGNSVATDGRYGLAAMADDVEAVAHTFGLKAMRWSAIRWAARWRRSLPHVDRRGFWVSSS